MELETEASIAFITDDRVSNEKAAVITRAINTLRNQFRFEMIPGQDLTEAQLLQKMEKGNYRLVLLPFHKYQSWSRIEGFFGINRTSGPTVAGYLSEPIARHQVPEPSGQTRRILLDFQGLQPSEILVLLRSLLHDQKRTGLKPLLDPQSPIYCESWYSNQGLGSRIDHILNLPEIGKSDWIKRSSAIRIILSAFWSLVYEEGPGKTEVPPNSSAAKTPKAYFQIGADHQSLVFRLYYYTLPHCTPKEALQQFWPNQSNPSQAAQLLLKYSDFLRVHTIHETSDLEIVVGLLQSASSEKGHDQFHTLWIEPLSAKLVIEPPYEAPGPQNPELRALPSVSVVDSKPRLVANSDKTILEAATKIKELREKVMEKEDTIRELRSGGVGTAPPLPPSDAEALLEAFQNRYFEAKFQIRQFELELENLENKKATPQEINELRLKMDALTNREKAWIKKLLVTLEAYKESVKKPKGSR